MIPEISLNTIMMTIRFIKPIAVYLTNNFNNERESFRQFL